MKLGIFHMIYVVLQMPPSPLTSYVSSFFGWWRQQFLKDIEEEELQPSVRKHRHQRWTQAAVKAQHALRAPHCGHGMTQVPVHLRRRKKRYTGFEVH